MRTVSAIFSWLATLACASAVQSEGLARAAAYSAAHGEHALLVWEKGRVVFERSSAQDAGCPRVFSITKSLVSIGVFRDALAGGLSLGQTAGLGAARGITLADLMNQTSGLSPARQEFYTEGLQDKEPVLRRLRRGDGGRFVYGPSHWEVLAEEIRLRRGTPVESWLRRFVPGARPDVLARWRKDDKGRLFFSTGARMSARDLLPAGREILRGMSGGRGSWPGDVRSLLAGGTHANRMYALGFWLNRNAAVADAREIDVESSLDDPRAPDFWQDGCLSRRAPTDLLAMIGTNGQRVYTVPSKDMIVIRLGGGAGFSDAEFLGRLFGS